MSAKTSGLVLRLLAVLSFGTSLLLWLDFHNLFQVKLPHSIDQGLIPFLLCTLPLLAIGMVVQFARRKSLSSTNLVVDLLSALLPLVMFAVLFSWFTNHV